MSQQALIFLVLATAMVLFVWERWRYDVVALMALLVLALTGVVPHDQVFSGFAHPAVVTVAAVLVVSHGLASSGLIERMAPLAERVGPSPSLQVLALCVVGAVCSAFMNNVGALALLLPLALRMSTNSGISPSLVLMPLAFASLLGGMTTLVGTPPNIIVASFRESTGNPPFGLFAYSPVGLGILVVGVAFLALLGWRLIPTSGRASTPERRFEIAEYTTQLVVPETSVHVGQRISSITLEKDLQFLALAVVRDGRKRLAPGADFVLEASDLVIAEVAPGDLDRLLELTGFEVEDDPPETRASDLDSEDVCLIEAIVMPGSRLVGRTVLESRLRQVYRLNLVGVSRRAARLTETLARTRLRAADLLLLQGPSRQLGDTLHELGLVSLAERPVTRTNARLWLAVLLFGLAIVALVARVLPAHLAFPSAAVLMMATRLVKLRDAYRAVDGSVLVLLGSMIPVGQSLEATGGAARLSEWLLALSGDLPVFAVLTLVMVLTMFLSDLMNNAATAVLMLPVATTLANSLDASADPFLMAVAVGASSAFLTPIGHQSNTLVMGPGGYRFGDYWRVGLPLEVLIVLVSVPLILRFWPL